MVINSAGTYMRPLAGVCLEAVEALDMPVCLNLYITAAGQKTSAPPHTDKQDVFVMQTQASFSTEDARGNILGYVHGPCSNAVTPTIDHAFPR